MRADLKRGLHWGGGALALAGLVFVGKRLQEHGSDAGVSALPSSAWIAIAALACAYAAANVLLGMAWWHLLAQLGSRVARGWAIATYGVSQVAKYVPGNIFHLAGRQALGMAAGVPGAVLAKSTFWELVLLSTGGAAFGALALPLVLPGMPALSGALAFAVAGGGIAAGIGRIAGARAAMAFAYHCAFLAASGLIFAAVLAATSSGANGGAALPALCGAYVVAWLAGLVTPGAPAGIGVRELVLLFLLKGSVVESELLFAIVAGRIVTVLGDGLYFAASAASRRGAAP